MMDINEIIKPENKVYGKTPVLKDNILHYCPGCSHGVVHKIIAEVIEEMGIQDKTIGISPVGCSVFAYNYLDIDWQQAAHGQPSRQPPRGSCPTNMSSHTRVTATSLPLVPPR